jgi:hypothetical protein
MPTSMVSIFRAVAVNNSLMTGTGSVYGAPWEVMRGVGGGGGVGIESFKSMQYTVHAGLPAARPAGHN